MAGAVDRGVGGGAEMLVAFGGQLAAARGADDQFGAEEERLDFVREGVERRVERVGDRFDACGAAVDDGSRGGLRGRRVQVDLQGGTLFVSWEGPGSRLWLEGPAEVSFTGQFEL